MISEDESDSGRFERLLSDLQLTVTRLEGSELTLNDAVNAYERCVELANACTAILDAAELRISQVRIETPSMREQPVTYYTESSATLRLLLSEDDDLSDLLGDDEG